MEQLLLQFGVSGATLGVLVIVVKAFLKNNKEISDSFKNTIDNHIQSDMAAKINLTNAVENNTKVIEKLTDKLI